MKRDKRFLDRVWKIGQQGTSRADIVVANTATEAIKKYIAAMTKAFPDMKAIQFEPDSVEFVGRFIG